MPTATLAPSAVPTTAPSATPAGASGHVYGVLQPVGQYLSSEMNSGIRLRTLEIGWDNYEPQDGVFNTNYVQQQLSIYQQMRSAGAQVILDFGLQYPPSWVFSYANSRYVNQYGDSFAGGIGVNGVNAVFNQTMRDLQARYIRRVIADLGTDFFAIRLGWGTYGEINYPAPSYNGHANSYWAFDAIAQGKTPGLAAGLPANPVPGWVPGTPSTNHQAASAFANWYMNSLKNYHDWQIATVRQVYGGRFTMLYSSWGVRPGQLNAAISVDLNGSTSAEMNGEVQKGFDYQRFVAGITDPGVIVYTTWLDANNSGDSSSDPAQWSPVHYLAYLAAQNPLHLTMFGESAGWNSYSQMQLCFAQMQKYGLIGLVWAFDPQLYSGSYATASQYAGLVSQNP